MRRRPGMYIGNPDETGLETCIFELLTDPILDFMAGFGDRVNVALNGEGSVTVESFGRGLEMEVDPRFGRPIAELILGTIHYDYRYCKRPVMPQLGLNGIGPKCVNALAERMEVEIRRGRDVHTIVFERGHVVHGSTRADRTQNGSDREMRMTFKPDPQIFRNVTYDFPSLARRLEQTAFLNKGLFVEFRDQRSKEERLWQTHSFFYPNGLRDFVRRQGSLYADDRTRPIAFAFSEGDISIEAAIQFDRTEDRRILSFVNQWQSREGGTHVDGFLLGLREAISQIPLPAGWRRQKIRVRNLRRGIIAVLAVSHPGPRYESSRRDKIGNPELVDLCKRATIEGLRKAFARDPSAAEHALFHMIR